MLKADTQSRLYCAHYIPSNIHCPDCYLIEKDYANRPLYAPLYVPLPNLPAVLDNSQLKLPGNFYVPFNEIRNNPKRTNDFSSNSVSDDCVEISTKNGIVRVPRSTLIHRSRLDESATHSNLFSTSKSACNSQQTFPGDFEKHAHRFTRSFSWKTKPEEPPYAQMQPLPKLIKRPGYAEMCCKNICWPTHQLCLCCGRNTADSCRKWSKSTGEYDYIDACWSSCALCSDDAYKILNTPVVYNEKIIDPEVLLPLDAELLYYSIQSAKRQQEQQQQQQQQQQLQTTEDTVPFVSHKKEVEELPSVAQKEESNVEAETSNTSSQEQQPAAPTRTVDSPKQLRKNKSSKSVKRKKSSRSVRKKKKKNNKKKSSRKSPRSVRGKSKKKNSKKSSRSRSRSKKRSSRPRSRSKKRSSRPRSRSRKRSSRSRSRSKKRSSRSKRKSRSKT